MPTILELFRSKLIETPNGLSETAEKVGESQKKTYIINNVASDGTNISGPIRAFNTLQLKDGKTARFTTDINNRPFSQIDTPNIFLKKTSFPLANKLKQNGKLAKKDGESILEEELTGLRPLQLLSQPVLYGTDIVKLTLREARSTRKMKLGTYPSTTGVDEAKVPSVEANSAKMIQSKIYTPTTLFLNDEFRNGKVLGKPGLFSKFRGTSEQLLLQLALSPIDTLKKLTSPNGTKLNTTKKDANTQIIVRNGNVGDNGNPVELFRYNTLAFDTGDDSYTKQLKKDSNVEDKDKTDLAGKLTEILEGSQQSPDNTSLQGIDSKQLTGNGFIYNIDFVKLTKKEKSRYNRDAPYTKAFGSTADARRDKVFDKDLSLKTYRGMENGSDFLNSKTILDNLTDKESDNATDFKDKDFATLKFTSVATGNRVRFRATVSGLTETFSPAWESNKFVGNPFNFYTYNSIERSVTFTFKVFSLNYEEHKKAWLRLSFLSSLVYPQSYVNKNYVTPPFIKFTLGDMYKDKSAFIESLTYTIDDNTTWETGLKQIHDKNDVEWIYSKTEARITTSTDPNITADGSYILPKIIEVAMTLKIIETPKEMYDMDNSGIKVLYGFTDTSIANNIMVPEKLQPIGNGKSVNTNNNSAGTGNTQNASANTTDPPKQQTTSAGSGGALGTSGTNQAADAFQENSKTNTIKGIPGS
jgi:hypothetical protein